MSPANKLDCSVTRPAPTPRACLPSLALAFALVCTACEPVIEPKFSVLPAYHVKLFASEVTWQREDGEGLPSDAASRQRFAIAEYLNEQMSLRRSEGGKRPARFQVKIVERAAIYDVTLVFQIGGNVWAAEGASGASPVDGVRDALVNAIDRAARAQKAKGGMK